MRVTVISDVKSGFVSDIEAPYQLAAYSLCQGVNTNELSKERVESLTDMPKLDLALIIRVNKYSCEPKWVSADRLQECQENFTRCVPIWRDMVQHNALKSRDFYRYRFGGGEMETFPRVTDILKMLYKPQLETWKVKEGAKFALKTIKKTGQDPDELINAIDGKTFDPSSGSMAFMRKRGLHGGNIHKCIQAYLLGEKPDIPDGAEELEKSYANFVTWADSVSLKLVDDWCEKPVVNRELKFAGTLDSVVTLETK